MKNILKHITLYAAVLAAGISLASCDEFPPVNYDEPEPFKVYTDEDFDGRDFITIADLKAMYQNSPVTTIGNRIVKAQVVSSDQQGNLYRTMYIQDETGGIELKMGTRNLYNEYKMGQWVYVDCNGLAIGNYRGMIQLGYPSSDPDYETAYIDQQYIIDTHIFRGELGKVEPMVIDAKEGITDAANLGRYVKVEGLTYGNRVFAIIYDDSDNSLYLGDVGETCGITTWAINETGFARYMLTGFDGAVPEDERANYSPAFYSVSQYFNKDGVDLQVRTSGYARFADTAIDEAILVGERVNLTGILTRYNSNNQFLLNDLSGVEIAE